MFNEKFLSKIFKKNIKFNKEKKTTKLCGLISEDCHIKNKFNDAIAVAISEYLKFVNICDK